VKRGHSVTAVERRTKRVPGASESELLVFCDKTTGATQFRSASPLNQSGGVERAAGQLAIQCLVRGYDPDNFVVLVPAEASLSDQLLGRARELLKEGREISCQVPLSPRQREILQSVVRSLSNKEIASDLNISVRTVKFHVSSLLEKFGVESRNALAQKATPMLGIHTSPNAQPSADINQEDLLSDYSTYGAGPSEMDTQPATPTKAPAPTLRFPRKLLTA
jgi:DNA-binding CsgD family transcriptional regulator